MGTLEILTGKNLENSKWNPVIRYQEVKRNFCLDWQLLHHKIQVIWESFPAILAISQNYNTDLQKVWKSSPVKIKKQYTTLYHPSGCIPNYTGFLPGHQFRHAMTYGHSSRSIETK